MWAVEPRYPLIRRMLFPFYGRDQLLFFFLMLAVVLVLVATLERHLALYMGVGGYVGAMLVMEIMTPSSLLLPSDYEQRVVQTFNGAPALKRIGNGNEWINERGRLYRWDSDTLRLIRVANGVLVTGGHRDLQILVAELRA